MAKTTSNNTNAYTKVLQTSSDDALATLTQQLEDTSETFRSNKSVLSSYNSSGMNIYPAVCPVCKQNYIVVSGEEKDSEDENISAYLVVQNPDRMFVTIEQLQSIDVIIEKYMNADDYTGDGESKVNHAKLADIANSIEWENIENKPEFDLDGISDAIENVHSHENKDAIDKLDEDINGEPLWNGSEWPYPTIAQELPLEEQHFRNVIISENDPENLLDNGDMWIQIDEHTNSISSFNVKFGRYQYYSLSLEDIIIAALDRITDPVKNIVSKMMITSHTELDDLDGGDSDAEEFYHLSKEEYLTLKEMISYYNSGKFGPKNYKMQVTIE